MRIVTSAIILLCLQSCLASAPIEDPAKIPSNFLQSLCSALVVVDPEIARDPELAFFEETRPVIDLLALRLTCPGEGPDLEEARRLSELTDELIRSFSAKPGGRPEGGGCGWLSVKSMDEARASEEFLIEISNPIRPSVCSTGDAADYGMFVRLSYAGTQGADWYWAELSKPMTHKGVRRLVPLDISDG